MTFWLSFSLQITTSWIWFISLLLIFTFHTFRLHYINKRNGQSFIQLVCIDVRHVSYLVIIPSLLIMILNVIRKTTNPSFGWVSNEMCSYSLRISAALSGLSKLGTHLFVALRCQVSTAASASFWYKFGLIMILSDILFVVFVLTPIPKIEGAIMENMFCNVTDTEQIVFIWFGMNDIIIGSYCLLVFVLPLLKIIKFEQQTVTNIIVEEQEDNSLYFIVKKILIYSSTALISTFVVTLIAMNAPEIAPLLMSLDQVINAYCVMMQFANVDESLVPSNLVPVFRCLQCHCCWSKSVRKQIEKHIEHKTTHTSLENTDGNDIVHNTDASKTKNVETSTGSHMQVTIDRVPIEPQSLGLDGSKLGVIEVVNTLSTNNDGAEVR